MSVRLERTDTCSLYWYWNSSTAPNRVVIANIPTNFPTPKLELFINDNYPTNLDIVIPAGWDPGRRVEILIAPNSTSAQTNRNTTVKIGDTTIHGTLNAYNQRQDYSFVWLPDSKRWRSWKVAAPSGFLPYFYSANGASGNVNAGTLANTVEEWLVLHPEWATP